MDNKQTSYAVMAGVTQILDIIRNIEPADLVDLELDDKPLGLIEGDYIFWHTYRQDYPLVKKVHKLTPQTTDLDILKIAAIDFEAIFGVIDPVTKTAVARPWSFTACEMVLVNYPGAFSGDVIVSTPFYEGIEIYTPANHIHFQMGT